MGWLLRISGTPSTERAELVGSMLWDLGTTGWFQDGCGDIVAGFEDEAEALDAARLLGPMPVVVGAEMAVGPAPAVTDPVDRSEPVAVPYAAASGGRQGRGLTIVPAGAFGHGGHPTTRLALDLLAATVRPGDRVLDIGTGTGVLALAAALSGAAAVTAVDNDPVAVASARANVATGWLPSSGSGAGPDAGIVTVSDRPVEALVAEAVDADRRFDVVVANVLLTTHRELAEVAASALTEAGSVVTAGYLKDQERELLSLYPSLTPRHRLEADDWTGHRLTTGPDDQQIRPSPSGSSL